MLSRLVLAFSAALNALLLVAFLSRWSAQRTAIDAPPPSGPRSRGRFTLGFTLLELLVVMGIVAALAGLLISALAQSQRAARLIQCKSNVRQLGLALRIYLDDHHAYPLFGYVEADGRLRSWTDLLAANLLQEAAGRHVTTGGSTCFECPSFRPLSRGSARPVTYGYSDEGYAFQGVGRKFESVAGRWTALPVSESEVLAPADFLVLGDGITKLNSSHLRHYGLHLSRWKVADPLELHLDARFPAEDLANGDRFLRKVHLGRATMAFADGHVESPFLKQLFEAKSEAALCRWNRDHRPHREWLTEK